VKSDDVPQDASFLEGHRKAAYAVDAEGKYVVVPSTGYEAEVAATSVALYEIDRAVQQAWEQVKRGEVSPLAYHFAVRQWPLSLAADSVGLSRLRIWWHLKPKAFAGLNAELKKKYCAALAISEAQLATVPDAPEKLMEQAP
jgi:hypothetical protein